MKYAPVALSVLATFVASTGLLAQDLIRQHSGNPGDKFGIAVSDVGDLNQDGFTDVVVGAVQDGVPSVGTGYANVYSGKDGSVLWALAGDSSGDAFGNSAGGAGDVNNDGYLDLIIGAIWDDNNGDMSGMCRAVSGLDGSTLHQFEGDATFDFFGMRVSSAGDTDQDGHDDILVGAVQWASNGNGYARIYSGKTGAMLHHFNGSQTSSQHGYSVSDLGDVNQDGFPDVLVGAWWDSVSTSGGGSAWVYSGQDGTVIHSFFGNSSGDHLGSSVAWAGDVDGDGVQDLILGASGEDTAGSLAGSAYVHSGKTGALLHHFTGEAAGDQFGNSVHGMGDADGDGKSDVVVGATRASPNGTSSGAAYVFSGADGSTLHKVEGQSGSIFLGASVSGAGDVNGDGRADFIVGAHHEATGGSGAGSAFLYSGRNFISPTGISCHGLSSTYSGVPRIGQTFSLGVTGALPMTPITLILGVSDSTWSGIPLPLDLGPLGAAGCALNCSIDFPFVMSTDALGSVTLPGAVPNDPTLIGLTVFTQWMAKDPAANSLGSSFSEALAITFQP